MSGFIERRRALRSKIRSNETLDIRLHVFATAVLVVDITLILYTLIAVTSRMTLSGIGLIDSLPIVLYILPLLIVLPLLVRGYYTTRFAPINFLIMSVSSVFFALLTLLVRGFAFFLVMNLVAVVIVFIMGRFRPESSIRKVGRKGCAIFLFFNILGLMFPLTTMAMGQTAIAQVTPSDMSDLYLDVPLAEFDFPYFDVTPDVATIQSLNTSGFGVNLRLLESSGDSWMNLTEWLVAMNSTEIPYTITLTTPRDSYVDSDTSRIGSTSVLQQVYDSHAAALNVLVTTLDALNITRSPEVVFFDMTLSTTEWQTLLELTRSVNLPGFSSLIRTSIDSIDSSVIAAAAEFLADLSHSAGLPCGVLIESFILDDTGDGDSLTTLVCGQTSDTLQYWDRVEVSCSRSKYSYEMNGDVGEYLAYTFSRSLVQHGSNWSIRLGAAGNKSDVFGRTNEVYNTIRLIADDIGIASGNGVKRITLESLPLLIETFGPLALDILSGELAGATSVGVTYTFRIYAFRAVFIAIDSFDFIML
ncbi:MAG: hypothetical protein ACFFCK_10665 [Promethearchaeota archaeon]